MKIKIFYERVNNDDQLHYQIDMIFGLVRKQNDVQALKVNEDQTMSADAKSKTVSLAEYLRLYKSYSDCHQNTAGIASLLRYVRHVVNVERFHWQTYIGIHTAPTTAIGAACLLTLKSIVKLYIETHTSSEEGSHQFEVIPAYQFYLLATRLQVEIEIKPIRSFIIGLRFILLLIMNPKSIQSWFNLIKTLRQWNRSETA